MSTLKIENKLLYYITLGGILFLMIVPILFTIGNLFADDNLRHISSEAFDKAMLFLLAKSVFIAIMIAVISTFLGTILGFLLYRTKLNYTSLIKLLILIPLFTSPYIQAVAWKDFSILFLNDSHLISSVGGVIIVLTFIFTPLSMLIIGSALNSIHSSLEESALIIVQTPIMILKILLPLLKPALLTSFILIFIFSISEFSVPAFLGVNVFTTEIFTQFSAFYNHTLAIIQSGFLVIICFALLFAERRYIADAPFLSIGEKGTQKRLYSTKFGFALGFLWFYLSISVVFPILVLFLQSFKEGTAYFWEALDLLLPTFSNSIFLALGGALISVFVGFIAGYFSIRHDLHLLNRMLLGVFAIPSIIFGISLIHFYNQNTLDFIYSSMLIVWIGYVGKFSFVSAKILSNAMKQIPQSIEESAQIIGINPVSHFIKILLPILSPALFASFLISFILNFGELGLTIMLYPPGMEIMPIKVFTIMANAPQGLTSSLTLIVFLLTLLLVLLFTYLTKSLFKRNTILK